MFTGIVSAIGLIREAQDSASIRRLRIACAYPAASLKLGESIACGGACLTVVAWEAEGEGCLFDVELGPETLACTAPRWDAGQRVNLERALKIGDDLSGHFVTGHVDGLAMLESVSEEGGSYRLTLSAPPTLSRFIAPKGSVTLDGIALTVNTVEAERFSVAIIPHTWANTTLATRRAGDALNMEIDLLARYVERLLEQRS